MTAGAPPAALQGPDPAGLAARTVEIADPDAVGLGDPVALAVAGPDGSLLLGPRGSVATAGVAAELRLPAGLGPGAAALVPWLAAVPTTDPLRRAASGPLAVAALPFVPGEPATVHVPAVTVVRTAAGTCWATVVGPPSLTGDDARRALAALAAAAGGRGVPGGSPATGAGAELRSVTLDPDEPGFEDAVQQALDAIASGTVAKVVLARQVTARFRQPVDQAAVLRRLRAGEPSCAVFAHRRGGRAFLGASPELLVRRRGDLVVSHPLAGTAPRRPSDAAAVAGLATAKERAEHRAAAEAVAARLRPWCRELHVPEEPGLVRLATVIHLGTRLQGRLAPGPGGTVADALTLAAALHPTPAVAGVPTGAALRLIAALEPTPRGAYAGPVGWVDGRGDGELVVAIRSATVDGDTAVAHAGAGIVAGSEPARERAETTVKLATALAALGMPADPLLTAGSATG